MKPGRRWPGFWRVEQQHASGCHHKTKYTPAIRGLQGSRWGWAWRESNPHGLDAQCGDNTPCLPFQHTPTGGTSVLSFLGIGDAHEGKLKHNGRFSPPLSQPITCDGTVTSWSILYLSRDGLSDGHPENVDYSGNRLCRGHCDCERCRRARNAECAERTVTDQQRGGES
jgi:hypothetical protein